MAEMAMSGIPLFPGDSEIDQIFKIFKCVAVFLLQRLTFPTYRAFLNIDLLT